MRKKSRTRYYQPTPTNGGRPALEQRIRQTMSQQLSIPVVNVGDVSFRPDLYMSIDTRDYEPNKPGRECSITLAGPHTVTFEDEHADYFYMWYLQFTNQAKVTPAGAGPLIHP